MKKHKKYKKLSPSELLQRKEQRDQRKEIRSILNNLGFNKLNHIDGKEFNYKDRTSELDDIFICENIILLTEYTIGEPHILKKKIFYDKINENCRDFINFMLENEKFDSFQTYYNENIKNKYTANQLKLKILYCSKKSISKEHKKIVDGVIYFDFHIVQYFKCLTKIIKLSGRYEFLEFLEIPFCEFGNNILGSGNVSTNKFLGHILPEEKSSFKEGYKIISFYIDAESLIKRAYVLRQEGWREKENIGHYQRMLVSKKILNMRKYLSEEKRVFINNIISTISEDNVKLFDKEGNNIVVDKNGEFIGEGTKTNVIPTLIEIEDTCNIIGIIDGQHRTYAYHEANDAYEVTINRLRKIQNLLVTGILFPHNEEKEKRRKFEANLFLEINLNQTKVGSKLQQEIELLVNPFSSIAIGKRILKELNTSGPLNNLIEQYSFEKGKIKTASIVSFGLKPLIKIDVQKRSDSLFCLWNNDKKDKLKTKNCEEYNLLQEYINFCVLKIRELFIAFHSALTKDQWTPYSPQTPHGILTVTFMNGVLNVLRLLVENNKINKSGLYRENLKKLNEFDFKKYKSSQYRKMGEDIYNSYFQ